MKSIRLLIVDDEPLARENLRLRLAKEADIEIVAECANGMQAVDAIRERDPDAVLLDVTMPGMDGFQVVERVGVERMPVVVFVTAHDQYAIRAFEAHALDYLLKPIDEARFAAVLCGLRAQVKTLAATELQGRLTALLGDRAHGAGTASSAAPDRWVIRTDDRVVLLPEREIEWVEATDDQVRIHTRGASHLLKKTMAEMESRLDPRRFVRIHRSTIVNLDVVRELQALFRGEYLVILRDGRELKLSRRYRDRLRDLLHDPL